jgi:hypothetical protein
MNLWPKGALSREEVTDLLQHSVRWQVEWCAGSRMTPESGRGKVLPEGVLSRIPSGAKRRKFQRGMHDEKTWVFAFLIDDDSGTLLALHEGP